MIDREKVLTVLRRRFPGADVRAVAAAANAIVGLPDEWEEMSTLDPELVAVLAHGSRSHGEQVHKAVDEFEFRVYRRRAPSVPS